MWAYTLAPGVAKVPEPTINDVKNHYMAGRQSSVILVAACE